MLIFALGFSIHEASATVLLVVVLTATAGLLGRIGTNVTLDWVVVLPFALAAMLGGICGGFATKKFHASTLTALFSFLLTGVAIFVFSANSY